MQANGDDHPEAAAKHLTDCKTLQAQGRSDGAGYLAGYVIECCLKTLIIVDRQPPERIHVLGRLGGEALRLASLPSSRTARYAPWHHAAHPVYDAANGWTEQLRYRPSGQLPHALAQQWVDEAEHVFSRTIVPLKLDGLV